MKKLIVLLLIIAVLPVLIAIPVQAATSVDVTITAMGFIIEAPSGFTISYVSDYETALSWTNPPDSMSVMIRAAYGHVPTDMNDGYLVYQGSGTNFNDTSISLATPDIVYYRAWAQRNDGIWGGLYADVDTEDIMSLSFLFLGVVVIMFIATGMAIATFFTRNKLLGIMAGFLFLAIMIGALSIEDFPLAELIVLFSGLMAVAMFLSPAYLKVPPPPPVVPPTYYEQMSSRIDRMRSSTGQFKPKGKDIIL